MAERDALWISAMFPADANFKVRPGGTSTLNPNVDQLAHPVRVDARKRVFLEDSTLDVFP